MKSPNLFILGNIRPGLSLLMEEEDWEGDRLELPDYCIGSMRGPPISLPFGFVGWGLGAAAGHHIC